MTATLTAKARTLLDRPVIANVATVDAEGRPQITPVWVDVEDGAVVFNTARGRVKDRNLSANPNIAVSVVDPDDAFNVVVVRGTARAVEEGADAHIDRLAKKYMGLDEYPMRQPGEVRVKYVLDAEAIPMQPAD
ncbi:MAG: PPOX class F420-dependent oxidoreductase [Actinomycetota bacterium]|nr:PPOX class F420-dependent oxidoreductase [Actinomycetota bacterium]